VGRQGCNCSLQLLCPFNFYWYGRQAGIDSCSCLDSCSCIDAASSWGRLRAFGSDAGADVGAMWDQMVPLLGWKNAEPMVATSRMVMRTTVVLRMTAKDVL